MIFFIVFLCWGSFLNALAFRLIFQKRLFNPRSQCSHCNEQLYWYDLIPVISWLFLKGRCRFCKRSISLLYPFIELITAIVCTVLFLNTPSVFFPAYFLFFSALIVTIRTDLETMLISRFVTLYALPLFVVFSAFGYLPISLFDSLVGALSAYLFLWSIARIFYLITHKDGMGQGDIELLAFIGSCTGLLGWWISLLIGSLLGSIIGLGYALRTKSTTIKLPFGPFLAFGAIFFVLFQDYIPSIIFHL